MSPERGRVTGETHVHLGLSLIETYINSMAQVYIGQFVLKHHLLGRWTRWRILITAGATNFACMDGWGG